MSGGSSIPPGFTAAGIAGTITAAGVMSGIGGGIGAGTAVAVGAAVAAGASAAVLTTGGDDATTSSVVAAVPTSTAATTSTILTGSTSSTTATVGASTTTVATTTVAPTTSVATTTIAPAVTACFNYGGKLNSCLHRWNASCSTGSIATYEWVVDTAGLLAAGTFNPAPSPNPVIDVDSNIGKTPDGGCDNEFISVKLIVTGTDSSVDTITLGTWKIDQKAPPSKTGLRTSMTSFLRVRPLDGTTEGRVVLNGAQPDTTNNSGPFRHQFTGQSGKNTIEAYTTPKVDGEGFWQFDFSGAEDSVVGSIRPEHGQVVIANERIIIFRLSGARDERVRFAYQRTP